MNIQREGFDILVRALDMTAARHRVIATNIANANTPNYRAKDLEFEKAFRAALNDRGVEAALAFEPEVVERTDVAVKSDGNTVHMEKEFSGMQKNQLTFEVYSGLLRQKLNMMRRAINGQG